MHAAATARSARAGAGALARSIPVPVALPPHHSGGAMHSLSHTAITKFLLCPDDFRRHYIRGERSPVSGAAFLGRVVDEAITLYYSLAMGGQTLACNQLQDAYRERFGQALAREERSLGVAWEQELPQRAAFALGLQALEVALRRVVPRLGRASATQRRFELKLAPELQWSLTGQVDLDTVRTLRLYVDRHGEVLAVQDEGMPEPMLARPQAGDDGAPALPASARAHAVSELQVAGLVDYKLKRTLMSRAQAESDLQAGLYLAERWLRGEPAYDFRFAQLGKPTPKRRKRVSASLLQTKRSEAQLRAVLVRVAQAAAQISACYERFGPDRPWGFAPPGSWKCDERYCAWAADRSCPIVGLTARP